MMFSFTPPLIIVGAIVILIVDSMDSANDGLISLSGLRAFSTDLLLIAAFPPTSIPPSRFNSSLMRSKATRGGLCSNSLSSAAAIFTTAFSPRAGTEE